MLAFSDEVNKTIRWAEETGFTFAGVGGDGHPVLVWSDGTRVNISGTTKNWNTVKNDRQRLARLSGQRFGTRKAGRFRKGISKTPVRGRAEARATGQRAADLRSYIRACESQARTPSGLHPASVAGLRKARRELAELDREAQERSEDRQ